MEAESKYRKYFFNTTTILASGTLLGYFYVYLYNAGYNDFFHIPQQMMSFSMPAILGSLIALFSTIGLLWSSSISITVKRGYYTNNPMSILILNISIMIILLLTLFALGARWDSTGVITIVVFIPLYILIFLVYPLVSHRKTKGYLSKVRESIKRKIEKNETVGDYIYSAPIYLQFTFFIVLAGSLLLAFYAGRSDAANLANFDIVNGDTHWLVVKYMDEKAILVEQDKGRLSGAYKYIDYSDTADKAIFSKKYIGKLQD